MSTPLSTTLLSLVDAGDFSAALARARHESYSTEVSISNSGGLLPIHACLLHVQKNNYMIPLLKQLLIACPESILTPTSGGFLPLHYAAFYTHSVEVMLPLIVGVEGSSWECDDFSVSQVLTARNKKGQSAFDIYEAAEGPPKEPAAFELLRCKSLKEIDAWRYKWIDSCMPPPAPPPPSAKVVGSAAPDSPAPRLPRPASSGDDPVAYFSSPSSAADVAVFLPSSDLLSSLLRRSLDEVVAHLPALPALQPRALLSSPLSAPPPPLSTVSANSLHRFVVNLCEEPPPTLSLILSRLCPGGVYGSACALPPRPGSMLPDLASLLHLRPPPLSSAPSSLEFELLLSPVPSLVSSVKAAGFKDVRVWDRFIAIELWDVELAVEAVRAKGGGGEDNADWERAFRDRLRAAMDGGEPIGVEVRIVIARA